ncbi:MAG: hypothetical protein ABIO70_06290 [Pseudomonadota bacterium]
MSPALPLLLLLLPARADMVSGPWIQAVTEDEAWVLWEGEATGLVLPPASLRVRASLRRSEERSTRAPRSALHAAS